MAHTSKNVLAVLLILTVIISLVGTLTVLSSLFPYQEVPVSDMSQASGEVTVYLLPPEPPVGPPVETTGEVTLNLITSKEGG